MAEYKGFQVSLTDDGKMACYELEQTADTWEEMKKIINAHKRESQQAKRVDVLVREYQGFSEAVTGAIHVGYRGSRKSVWITKKNGKERETKSFDNLYLDTPENREIIKRYIELQKQSREIDKQAEELLKTAETFKP